MPESAPIVIVGGGHAGAQLCAALVAAGRGAGVHLVCAEVELPYQRPPLSKAFLKSEQEVLQLHRGEPWFDESGIALHRGDAAVALDPARRMLSLASGREVEYAQLVLATGAHARGLPHLPDGLANVAALRNAADAVRLRALLAAHERVTVLGGGFIGLEIAATARVLGKAVTVLESAPRLLTRSVSAEIAEHVAATHRASGIDVRLGVAVGGFEVEGGRLAALAVDGVRQPVDLLVLGVGAVPEHALASAAGLECDNGIVVDAAMRTSDPHVLAIGDCASFPEPTSGRRLRLESVQNANDHARAAAQTLLGDPRPYTALPWFWSEQGSMRLQMAGLVHADGERFHRLGASAGSFSILHFRSGALACVESVNASHDHMAARKLLEAGTPVGPAAACRADVPLRSLL